MKRISLIFSLFFGATMFAQTGNGGVLLSSDKIFLIGSRNKSAEYVIDGSPYVNGKEFQKVLIDGYSKDVQDLRYNAYEDEMEFLNNKENYYINKLEGTAIAFPSLNKTYIVKNYTYLGNKKFGYLVLLSKKDDKYGLYKREKVELIAGEKSPNAYNKDSNDYFAKEKDLYLISDGDNYYKFPKNVDELTQELSLDKKILQNFIKSNKISFSKESDMIKLVEFINKL